MYIYVYLCIFVYICLLVHLHIYTCIHIYLSIHIHVSGLKSVDLSFTTYLHAYIFIYICTSTLTHTYVLEQKSADPSFTHPPHPNSFAHTPSSQAHPYRASQPPPVEISQKIHENQLHSQLTQCISPKVSFSVSLLHAK